QSLTLKAIRPCKACSSDCAIKRLWAKGPAGSRVELTFMREGISRRVQITSADRLASLRKPKGV
ncbi:MAG: hypothetical protein EBZ06_04025, partial [Betaproteobacteria bacterium]|nr:hypothetical protein [Betaproteobacteria bacterium]